MEITKFINGKVEYDNYGQYLWVKSKEGQQLLGELRGWGHIQNMFKDQHGRIDFPAAGQFQDEIGKFVQDAINEKIERLKQTK